MTPEHATDHLEPPSMTAEQLRALDAEQLESLFAHRHSVVEVPRGVFVGETLARLDNPGARRAVWAWTQRVGFEWLPFGVDFDRCVWFFGSRHLAIGRFQPRIERSRWRETTAVALHYDPSRLPARVRTVLYDEVKPLRSDLILGIGGINAPRDQGDHFFFMLRRA